MFSRRIWAIRKPCSNPGPQRTFHKEPTLRFQFIPISLKMPQVSLPILPRQAMIHPHMPKAWWCPSGRMVSAAVQCSLTNCRHVLKLELMDPAIFDTPKYRSIIARQVKAAKALSMSSLSPEELAILRRGYSHSTAACSATTHNVNNNHQQYQRDEAEEKRRGTTKLGLRTKVH
jgi:hypothetical protein